MSNFVVSVQNAGETTPPSPLKPLVKWSGGKSDEIKESIPHIPDVYDTYLEPFIGGGALYFHTQPNKSVINDVHPELIDLYKSAQQDGGCDEIYKFMQKHPNEESVYYQVRSSKGKTACARPAIGGCCDTIQRASSIFRSGDTRR